MGDCLRCEGGSAQHSAAHQVRQAVGKTLGPPNCSIKPPCPQLREVLSRFVFWVVWLGFILLGVGVLGILGLQEAGCEILFLPAAAIRSHVHHVFRIAGGPASFLAPRYWLR